MLQRWFLKFVLLVVMVGGAPGCINRDKPEPESPQEAACKVVAHRSALNCTVNCAELQLTACYSQCKMQYNSVFFTCLHPESVDAAAPRVVEEEAGESVTPAALRPTNRPTVYPGKGFPEHFSPQ